MIKSSLVTYQIIILFHLFPLFVKAALPWQSNPETIGTGGNFIKYEFNPATGISINYVMPYQLKELSIRKIKAEKMVMETLITGELGQSGDEVFMETICSLGAGKLLSDKMFLSVACSYYKMNASNGSQGNTVFTEILFLYQPFRQLMFGSYLFNPTGSEIKNKYNNFRLNQSLHIGCNITPDKNISMILEFEKVLGETFRWHIGTDYKIIKAFRLSLGLSGSPLMPSFGFGWNLKRTSVSAAFCLYPIMGVTSAVSIKYYWAKK